MSLKQKLVRRVNVAKLKPKNSTNAFVLFIYRIYKDFKIKLFERKDSRAYLYFKDLERNILGGKLNFVTIDELVFWTEEWIKTSDLSDFDLVVAIPRSGLIIGSIIATKLGKPLTTPALFPDKWISRSFELRSEYRKVLLIDDSISTNAAMEAGFNILKNKTDLNITTAALIVSEEAKNKVDLFFKIVPKPRIFEWNMLHAKKNGTLAIDMDGVVCEEPLTGLDEDEKSYSDWIKKAKPYLVPTFKIDWIVSNRLEKFRTLTEKWLKENNVSYRYLILRDSINKNENKADHKIRKLMELKPDIFWESSPGEAKQIWEKTKIPVLCTGNNTLYN